MKKIITLIVLFYISTIEAIAQGCSTCTATANTLDRDSAEGLNIGIVYLAFTPLIFMAVLGYIWYKRSRGQS